MKVWLPRLIAMASAAAIFLAFAAPAHAEKRVALDAWAAAVTEIVEGKSDNVVRLAVTA